MKTPREILLNHHRNADPKLVAMWNRVAPHATAPRRIPMAVFHLLWRELVWPCRRIWAGLACAWALIIVVNATSYEPAPQVAGKAEPPSREEMRALVEQRQLLAQMMGSPPPIDARQSNAPGPRSECNEEASAA